MNNSARRVLWKRSIFPVVSGSGPSCSLSGNFDPTPTAGVAAATATADRLRPPIPRGPTVASVHGQVKSSLDLPLDQE